MHKGNKNTCPFCRAGISKGQIFNGHEGETMTNDIHELHFDSIVMNLKATNSKEVLKKISEHTSRLIGTPKNVLFADLYKQEQESSSGIGGGVAIAHKRLPRLTKPFIVFAKLDKAVEFHAVDSDPVDLVCLVLSPEFEGPKHLSRLSKVSRHFGDQNFCTNLRAAQDDDDVRMVLKELNSRRMAA